MPSHQPRCRVCGSTKTVPWKDRSLRRPLVAEDLRITDSRYGLTLSLSKCNECSFVYADGEELAQLTGLYAQLSDPDYERGQISRALQMRWLLKVGRQAHASAKTLLDVGAGTGLLVAEAKRMGFDAAGVEPSRALVEAARRLNGIEILNGVLPHPALRDRTFDLVYLVDVIEHVWEPLNLLRHCAAALSLEGILVVVTPDIASVAARLLGKRWWHFRLAHVGYFSRRSMGAAAEAAGYRVLRVVRARWFFPVHYLADRLSVYLPVGFLNRLAGRVPSLRWIYNRVVPLNLGDSLVFFLTPH